MLAAVATLIGAALIAGYSAFYLSSAIFAYTKCNPPPSGSTCTGQGFWGFGPTLFFAADLVSMAIAVLLAVIAFLLMTRSERHGLYGVVIIAGAVVSLIAYGGAFVGAAAGALGGVIAIVYRTPRYRGLVQWVAGPPRRPGPAPFVARTPSVSERSSSPVPRPSRASTVMPAGPPPEATPVPPARPVPVAVPESGSPSYGTLSAALAGKPTASPGPTPYTPPPVRPLPGPTQSSEPRRPLTPYTGPTGTPPPALPSGPAVGSAPKPVRSTAASSASAAPPATEETKTVPPAPVRQAWKCPKCGLTNAPWSRSCTQCRAPAPPL